MIANHSIIYPLRLKKTLLTIHNPVINKSMEDIMVNVSSLNIIPVMKPTHAKISMNKIPQSAGVSYQSSLANRHSLARKFLIVLNDNRFNLCCL